MTIKGPAIFLAQFAGDKEPFNTLENITKWAADVTNVKESLVRFKIKFDKYLLINS